MTNSVPQIHVHSSCDKHTLPFVIFMWETMLALANRPEDLRLTVHCMGPAAVDRLNGKLKQAAAVQVSNKRKDAMNGSYGHAVCILDSLSMTNDGDIHIIADSDTVVVAKGWDDYIRRRMHTDGVGIMGTTYEDLGGFSSGGGTTQAYKKVPTFTWCALAPRHNWRDLDVLPNKAHIIPINSPKLSKIYNLPEGYSVFGEAGYQLPQYLHDKQLSYDGWRQLKPTKEAVVLKGLSDYHEEYHVCDDVPFVLHHRGSMKHSYRGDKVSNAFYGAVDRYLNTERERPSRWSWDPEVDGKPSETAPVDEATPVVEADVEQPQNAREAVPYVRTDPREWLKVSWNGAQIRKKGAIDRASCRPILEFDKPCHDSIGHLRLEGVITSTYGVLVPATPVTPYVITCRNATNSLMVVSSNDDGPFVNVPANKTVWVLVDVDGCHRVE